VTELTTKQRPAAIPYTHNNVFNVDCWSSVKGTSKLKVKIGTMIRVNIRNITVLHIAIYFIYVKI
jgi:hypothetical protein